MRGLDLLESLPFVDHSSGFGTIGHSLGGHNSVYTAVFDDRLKVVVSSCGLDSYVDCCNGNPTNWDPEKGWCQTRYMRKLAECKGRLADIPFDFHEMIGSLAPRDVLIIAPTKDSNFRADSADRIAAPARPVFTLIGHENRLRVEHPDCDHDFPAGDARIGLQAVRQGARRQVADRKAVARSSYSNPIGDQSISASNGNSGRRWRNVSRPRSALVVPGVSTRMRCLHTGAYAATGACTPLAIST
jgi:hypothetical protein